MYEQTTQTAQVQAQVQVRFRNPDVQRLLARALEVRDAWTTVWLAQPDRKALPKAAPKDPRKPEEFLRYAQRLVRGLRALLPRTAPPGYHWEHRLQFLESWLEELGDLGVA